MKRFSLLSVFILFTFTLWGQDFLSKGKSYYTNGNYSEAISQFEAQIAFLDSKNVSKNADEYISVEKLLARAKTCLPLYRKARTAFSEAEKTGSEDSYNAAVEAFEKLLKQNPSDKNAKAMISKCQASISHIEYEQEASNAWTYVDQGNIDAIEAYIAKYSESKQVAVARQQITNINDNIAWENASSKEDYQNYLKDYPQGLHKDLAIQYIDHWEETVFWKNISDSKSIASYNEYIEKYPNGLFLTEAHREITSIQDDEAWATAESTNTLQSYLLYSAAFPSGKHQIEAQRKKNEFEAIQKKERALFEAFKKSPSLNGLRSFESAYPNSEYNPIVYDTYALFLCENININACKKSDFTEAMSFARTKATRNKIIAKEQEWKNQKSKHNSQIAGKIVGYTLGGIAIIAGVIAGSQKQQ